MPDVLLVDEAAHLLRLGRNQVYELVRIGQIPSVRLGRCIRVPKAALIPLLLAENGHLEPTQDPQTEFVTLRFTRDEAAKLTAKAKAEGETLVEFVRRMALYEPEVSAG